MPKERLYKVGEHIGPYEVLELLASGGMGHLYVAKPSPEQRGDLIDLGLRQVVVKVARLDAIPEDPREYRALRERFDRESRTLMGLTRLGHPNVVRGYDSGWDDGLPYYAMERVDGVTLGEAQEQRPHLGQMLCVLAELCGAVAFLHNGGICHRDLKPSNVMIRREGGSPVLIDFGSCLPPTGHSLTGPHELLGTLEYVSPEYAEHLLDPTQTRAYAALPTDDVWSLGITFYGVLTGAVPWRTRPGHREALLREIQRAQVPHPSEVNKQVPRALGDLVMRMLEPSRRLRIQTASGVLELLGEAAEKSNVLGRVPAPRKRHARVAPTSGNARGQLSTGMLAVIGLAITTFTLGTFYGGAVVLKRDRAVEQGQCPPSSGAQASTNPGQTQPEPARSEPHPWDSDAQSWDFNAAQRLIAKGLPLPRRPLRGQLLGPCAFPYVEMVGACWKPIRMVRRDGSDAPCTSEMAEVEGKCYMPVFDDKPSTLNTGDAGTK